MEIAPTGPIYSIEVGIPKQGFKYHVGQTFKRQENKIEIMEIMRDNNAYFIHGNLRYIVYARLNKENELFAWKYFENVPISVTCFDETV